MAKRTSKTEAGPAPMDASVREMAVGRMTPNQPRNVYAVDTLIAEVLALFPETAVETGNYNNRNAALDVQFKIDQGDAILSDLLGLVREDDRVEEVLDSTARDLVLVSFHSNARTQDSREPFGLAEAFDVMIETEEGSL